MQLRDPKYGVLTARRVQPQDREGVAQVQAILAEAADWLLTRGIDQWPAGGFSLESVRQTCAAHTVFLCCCGTEPAGTLTLRWTDPVIWGVHGEDDAGYLHRLAIRRRYQGLGRQLLNWAEWYVADRGKTRLRLDCMAENEALNAYYRQAGYAYKGRREGSWWRAHLYEKRVHALRLGFLASHGGSGMQAVVGAIAAGDLDAVPVVVVSNNRDAEALSFAVRRDIPRYHLDEATHGDGLDAAICAHLEQHGTRLVLLSGYLKKVGPQTLARFENRILNIHPALLPKFGGQGMYGRCVHEAVLAAGERVSGATVHVVDEHYDHGPVLARREVPVAPGETPQSLAARIQAVEGELLVETLQQIRAGSLALPPAGDGVPPAEP